VHEWIEGGATVVGGCCGMEPDHIAHIVTLVRE
jgi:S-methylmethionine-dependent homocysteine/selenocysteine methylase